LLSDTKSESSGFTAFNINCSNLSLLWDENELPRLICYLESGNIYGYIITLVVQSINIIVFVSLAYSISSCPPAH